MKTHGIHHISMISRHGQEVIDFYSGLLGLKLVKKTLNFDNPNQYHITFGTNEAELGSLLTFFPHPKAKPGIQGDGQVRTITLAVPENSFKFWQNRLTKFEVSYSIIRKFNQNYLTFKDLDGIEIELLETNEGKPNIFEFNGVTKEVAVKGIYNVVLNASNPKTEDFLKAIGYQFEQESSLYKRYKLETSDVLGRYIEIYKPGEDQGNNSIGTVHHLALTVFEKEIEAWDKKIRALGLLPSEIKDRKYFRSMYFKEFSNILIELATEKPGMTEDESVSELGTNFLIPPHFKNLPKETFDHLMPLEVKEVTKLTKYDYIDMESYKSSHRHRDILNEINLLARKAKTEGLTEAELERRAILRKEYVASVTGGVRNMVEKVKLVDEEGNEEEGFIKKGKVVETWN